MLSSRSRLIAFATQVTTVDSARPMRFQVSSTHRAPNSGDESSAASRCCQPNLFVRLAISTVRSSTLAMRCSWGLNSTGGVQPPTSRLPEFPHEATYAPSVGRHGYPSPKRGGGRNLVGKNKSKATTSPHARHAVAGNGVPVDLSHSPHSNPLKSRGLPSPWKIYTPTS